MTSLTTSNNIQLVTIDHKSELSKLENFCTQVEYDFLISISWRYLISPTIFNKAKLGAINIHRGDLPKYAGMEPSYWWHKQTKQPLYNVTHWGKK